MTMKSATHPALAGIAILLLAAAAVGAAAVAQDAVAQDGKAAPTKVRRARLENGLRLILRPVEGARNVAVVVLYDVGGDDDPEGRSGLGHLVEHVYVTAAAGEAGSRSAQRFFASYPLGANAQTGDDYTVIATVFPAARLRAELEEAAARMADLKIEEADLLRERPRLLEEVANMFGRFPALGVQNLASERVRPTPLGGRKGGLPGHVAAITVEELRDRWSKLYKPGNATLTIVGAIDPGATAKLVKDLFGEIPPGEKPPERPGVPEREPRKAGAGAEVIEVKPAQPGQGALACVAVRGPRPDAGEYPAFALLCTRLMMKAFTEGQGRQDAITMSWAPIDDPERVRVAGPLQEDESPEEAVVRIEKWIDETLAADLSDRDRMHVRQQMGFFFWPDSMPDAYLQNLYGLAFALGRHGQLGHDPAALDRAIASLETADLRRAAATIFAKGRRAAVVVRSKK